MTRRRWVQIDGKLVEVTAGFEDTSTPRSATIRGDLPDFVSPIDGTVVSGRAGMREHCVKHNVVPTEELKGLPPKTMNQHFASPEQYRQQTKQVIADIINSRGYGYK